MTTLTSQPQNPNFLAKHNVRFSLMRAPGISFFSESANLPAIDLDVATQATPFIQIPRPGTKIHYSDFEYTFLVDEDMRNYMEVYNWMNQLGFPDDFSGYPKLNAGDGVFSDGTMTILSSKKNPNIEVTFTNMFPYSISELNFSVSETSVNYHLCNIKFKYQRFWVKKISDNEPFSSK